MTKLAFSLILWAIATSTTAYCQNAEPPKQKATKPAIPDLDDLLKEQPPVQAQLFELEKERQERVASLEALQKGAKGKETKQPDTPVAPSGTEGNAPSAKPESAPTRPADKPTSTPFPSQYDRKIPQFERTRIAEIDEEIDQLKRDNRGLKLPPILQERLSELDASYRNELNNTPPPPHKLSNLHITNDLEVYRQAERIAKAYNGDGAQKADGFVFDEGRRGYDSGARRESKPVDNSQPNPGPFFRNPNRPALGEPGPEVINSVPREEPIIPKDGGVRITATAEISGITPADVASATYDKASGVLTLALRSGEQVKCRLDRDDFAIAVRCAFEKKVDPCLSMDISPGTPGFNSVVFSGPMASTHFGRVMFHTDQKLADIMFNSEGEFRAQLSRLIPGIDALILEANNTMSTSSRVYLRAAGASYAVANGTILPRQVDLRVEVEALEYESEYYQESLHRLARTINDNMDSLVANFPEFRDFRRLVDHVALAKWLERNQIAFDWKSLQPAPKDEFRFPGHVATVGWRRTVTGPNLDGWRLNLASDRIETERGSGRISLRPKGSIELEILNLTWSRKYAVRFVASTEGPVEFILRQSKDEPETSLTLDTKGRLQVIELYVLGSEWRVIAPGVNKTGRIEITSTELENPKKFNHYGVRIPIGSKISLLSAATQEWPPPPIQVEPEKPKPQVVQFQGTETYYAPSKVQAVAITPDSQRFFVGLDDGQILAYDLATGMSSGIGLPLYVPIMSLAVNARGDCLAVGTSSGHVVLVNLATFKVEKVNQFTKQTSEGKIAQVPIALAYAPSQDEIVCGLNDGNIFTLSVTDLKKLQEVPPPDGYTLQALAVSPQGAIAGSYLRLDEKKQIESSFVRTFSVPGLQALTAVTLWPINVDPAAEAKPVPFFVRSLAFDPSGTYLALGCSDGNVKTLRRSDLAFIQDNPKRHQQAVATIAFAPDGRMVTGGYDALCQFWTNIFQVGRSYPTFRGTITCGAISPDGSRLVRAGTALDIVPLNQPADYRRVAEFGGGILSLAISADKKRLVTGGMDNRLILWNMDKPISALTRKFDDWVTGADFVEGETSVAAGLGNGSIEILSTSDLNSVRSWQAHAGRVAGVATIGNKLASIGDDGMVRIWTNEGNRVRSRNLKAPCTSIAVSGERFAVGTREGLISIQTLADPPENLVIQARPQSITALAFSDEGKRLTAGYFDGSLEAFDATSGQSRSFQQGKGDSVLALAVHPGRHVILAGYRDGNTRVLNAGSLHEIAIVNSGSGREVFGLRWADDDVTFASAGASSTLSFIRVTGNLELLTR